MSSRKPVTRRPTADRDAALVVPGHQQQRLEDEILGVHRDDVEMADLPHRRVERQALQHHRL